MFTGNPGSFLFPLCAHIHIHIPIITHTHTHRNIKHGSYWVSPWTLMIQWSCWVSPQPAKNSRMACSSVCGGSPLTTTSKSSPRPLLRRPQPSSPRGRLNQTELDTISVNFHPKKRPGAWPSTNWIWTWRLFAPQNMCNAMTWLLIHWFLTNAKFSPTEVNLPMTRPSTAMPVVHEGFLSSPISTRELTRLPCHHLFHAFLFLCPSFWSPNPWILRRKCRRGHAGGLDIVWDQFLWNLQGRQSGGCRSQMDSILWDILGLKGLVSHMLIRQVWSVWSTNKVHHSPMEDIHRGTGDQKTCLVASSYPKGMLVSWASNPELESANQMWFATLSLLPQSKRLLCTRASNLPKELPWSCKKSTKTFQQTVSRQGAFQSSHSSSFQFFHLSFFQSFQSPLQSFPEFPLQPFPPELSLQSFPALPSAPLHSAPAPLHSAPLQSADVAIKDQSLSCCDTGNWDNRDTGTPTCGHWWGKLFSKPLDFRYEYYVFMIILVSDLIVSPGIFFHQTHNVGSIANTATRSLHHHTSITKKWLGRFPGFESWYHRECSVSSTPLKTNMETIIGSL